MLVKYHSSNLVLTPELVRPISFPNPPSLLFPSLCPSFLESWLPNYMDSSQNDFHTKYVCTVSYDLISGQIASWQIHFRYSQIKELYYVVQKYNGEINDISPLIEQFPLASISQGLFGIDDKVRNERMSKFDLWMREVVMNPVCSTIWEIAEAVYQFLEVQSHTHEV